MNKGLKYLTLSRVFSFSANSLISAFGIVYLYEIFDSIYLAVIPFIAIRLLYATMLPLLAPYISLIGIRKALIISTILTFIAGSTFFLVEKYNSYLIIIVILISISYCFYYLPFIYYVNKFTKGKSRGHEVGFLQGSVIFMLAITPFIAGYISDNYSFIGFSFFLAILLVISIIPLYKLKNYHFHYTAKLKNFFKIKTYQKLLRLNVLNNSLVELSLFWYLYLFVFFGSFTQFGMMISLVTLTGAILSFIFGKYLDTHNRKRLIFWEGILSPLSWIARFFAVTPLTIFLADAFYKLNRYIKDESIDVVTWDLIARGNHDEMLDEKIILREMSVNVGKAFILSCGLIIVSLFGLKATFLFAALVSILFFFV